MHKKYNKYGNKEISHKKSSRREHVKYRKGSEASVHGLDVSQNSKCEVNNYYRDVENKENLKLKHKHSEKLKKKHTRAENIKGHDRHGKKHDKHSNHSHNKTERLFEDEHTSRHREKSLQKEKYDKEKFNNVEKYLEELNRANDTSKPRHRSRSFSLESAERSLRCITKHIRREKTFHAEESRRAEHSISHIRDEKKMKSLKLKEGKADRKHKHQQKESSREKVTEDAQKQVMYCHVETKSPFKIEKKKYDLEDLYSSEFYEDRKIKSSTKPRKSSSSEMHRSLCGDGKHIFNVEDNPKLSSRRSKEKRSLDRIKYKSRKSKMKEYSKHVKEPKNPVYLGSYHKHIVVERQSQNDNRKHHHHERNKHRKREEPDVVSRYDNENKETVRESRRRKKHSSENIAEKSRDNSVSKQDHIREKLEDDLKGYFTKIQSLIDKKLEHILHSSGKESKDNDNEEDLEHVKHTAQKRKEKSVERKEEKHSHHRSRSKNEKRPHKSTENDNIDKREKGETRKSHLEKQKEMRNDGESKRHKHHRTSKHSDNRQSPEQAMNIGNDEDHRRHKRHRSPKQLTNPDKSFSSENVLNLMRNASKVNNEQEYRKKSTPRASKSPNRSQRRSSSNKRNPTPDKTSSGRIRDEFRVEGIEPAKLLDSHLKNKSRKRLERPLNLECKTVSIIGIPSQIKESLVISQAQTSTSMNAINTAEDTIEKKKQSKRFKLYYKYSLADNNCSHSSGHSSDRKSVISDSYRVLSDQSEGRVSDNVESMLGGNDEEPTKDSDKVILVMKRENVTKNIYGDILSNDIVVDRHRRKHRKQRIVTPDASRLNNILEESSNICFLEKHNKMFQSVNNEVNCKYFQVLNTSSSDCNLEMPKKPLLSDWNSPSYFVADKHYAEKIAAMKKHIKNIPPEKYEVQDSKLEGKTKASERHAEKKTEVVKSNDKVHKAARDSGRKYNSKSDINISYDTPHLDKNYKVKVNKGSRLPVLKREDPRLKNTFRKLPDEEFNNKNVARVFPDLEDEQYAFKKKIIEESEPEAGKYPNRKSVYHAVTNAPGAINKKYVEREVSPLRFPESYMSEKAVKTNSCQWNCKELVDVGVEADTANDKFNKYEGTVLDKKKDTKVTGTQKPNSDGRKERVAKNVEKSLPKTNEAAVETDPSLEPKPRKQDSNLDKKCLPSHKDASKTKRPSSQPYKRQKSDIVGIKRPLDFGNKSKLLTMNVAETRDSKRPSSSKNKSINEKPEITSRKEHQIIGKPCMVVNTPQLTLPENNDELQKNEKHIRCASFSNKSKNEERSLRSSKSAVNVRVVTTESVSAISSLVNLDEFTDTNFLNSNSQSLDKYVAKSIISDNPHTSRLFLTKDFSRKVNSYQRRKMYDESIRKKMKSKFQKQLAPQVFEVRFLTLEEGKFNEGSDEASDATQKSSQNRSKLPTFTCNSKNSFRKKSTLTSKKSLKNASKKQPKKESGYQFNSGSNRNPFGPISDVDQLNKFRRKKFADKSVEEIFVKGNQLKDSKLSSIYDYCKQLYDIQSSSLIIQDSAGSTDQKSFSFDKSNIHDGKEGENNNNFLHLVDYLCKSIVSYCNSKLNLPQECNPETLGTTTTSVANDEINENITKISGDEDKSEISPKNYEKSSSKEDTLNNSSSNQNPISKVNENPVLSKESVTYEGELFIKMDSPRSLVSSHLSCPALARTPSSFEFLYEDEPDFSKEVILENLTKPLETILGYALSNNNSLVHTETFTVFKRKVDQISNCPTDSGESGYWSNCSRKFSSVASFFKKPNVASLLKPVSRLQTDVSNKNSKDLLFKSTSRITNYNSMAQKCHEYAQKVRMQSENKVELEEPFQEIPLDVLLGKKGDNFNSNCSLCKELSKIGLKNSKSELTPSEVFEITDTSLLREIKSDAVVQSESELETLIYYENQTRQPSLEIVKLKKVQSKKSDISIHTSSSKDIIECQLVLSNTNLNTCSLTLIDAGQMTDANDNFNGSVGENVREIPTLESTPNGFETAPHRLDCRRNVSSTTNSTLVTPSDGEKARELFAGNALNTKPDKRHFSIDLASIIQNPTEVRKTLAKKFFENLLQVYDREVIETNRLFQDNVFVNDLLESIKSANDNAKHSSKKNGKEKIRNIKGKLKGCIDKVFSPKGGNSLATDKDIAKASDHRFEKTHQENLKVLAYNARRYFSLFVQAVSVNKDINDEMKIFGLLKLLDRIENGDFSILRKQQDVNFEEEIKEQVREGFLNIYKASLKEAKKCKRSLTADDLKLITAFICKYRIGLLSKTDLIASYIGRGLFKTEAQLRAAVTYLIRSQTKDVNLKDFEEYCNICTNYKN